MKPKFAGDILRCALLACMILLASCAVIALALDEFSEPECAGG